MLDGALFFVKSAKCGNPDMTISGFFLFIPSLEVAGLVFPFSCAPVRAKSMI